MHHEIKFIYLFK